MTWADDALNWSAPVWVWLLVGAVLLLVARRHHRTATPAPQPRITMTHGGVLQRQAVAVVCPDCDTVVASNHPCPICSGRRFMKQTEKETAA